MHLTFDCNGNGCIRTCMIKQFINMTVRVEATNTLQNVRPALLIQSGLDVVNTGQFLKGCLHGVAHQLL